jgi:hypothetical protein
MFNLKELASAVLAISTFAIASITNFNFFEESKIASNATSELTTANTATPIVDQSQSLKKESLTKPDEDQTKQQPKPLHISTNPDGTIKLQLNKKLIPTIKTPSLPRISIGEPAEAIIPSSLKDLYEITHTPRQYFTRGNIVWGLAQAGLECTRENITSTEGPCGRNRNLIYVSSSQVYSNYKGDCSGDYQTRAASKYASDNNLRYLFYTPQNGAFTFEKK